MHFKTWYRNGGEPRMGRHLRALFNAAGVEDLEISAAVWCYATPEETIEWGDSYAERLLTSPMGSRAVEYGYRLRMVETAVVLQSVDTPADLREAERLMQASTVA